MKLMLTSAGITNKSLANSLKSLVGEKLKIAFIPTAANVEEGSKDWLIQNYMECEKLGEVDIVDISALEKNIWLSRLQKANTIFVGGGNTSHLMKWIIKSGLKEELPDLLKDRVYVGISAGAIVTNKKLSVASEHLYGDEIPNSPLGLGITDFYFRPHLNSPYFPKVKDELLKEISKKLDGDLYALDDNSGMIYSDGKIEIISKGKWKKYEQP